MASKTVETEVQQNGQAAEIMGTGSKGVTTLVNWISAAGLKSGDRLPAIRVLAAKMGVPPTRIRDAVLQAQSLGMLEVRPRSGTYIQAVDYGQVVDTLASTIDTALTQEDRHLIDLLEARRLVEIELAGLAAQRRRPSELAQLREILELMGEKATDYDSLIHPNERFHLHIAKMAGNEVLETMLRSLLLLLRHFLTRLVNTPKEVASDRKEHEAIFRAILSGDADKARQMMADHIKEITRYLSTPTGML